MTQTTTSQPAGATSSPCFLKTTGLYTQGAIVDLPTDAYANTAASDSFLDAGGLKCQVTAGHVGLVGGKSTIIKQAEYNREGDEVMKINTGRNPDGTITGVYGVFRLHAENGKPTGVFLTNDTPDGHMHWMNGYLDGLDPIEPFRASTGGGTGGGLTPADVIQIVKDWLKTTLFGG